MPPSVASELSAALLQAAITVGLASLCAMLFVQFRKRYFLWWGIAWLLYVLRIGAIVGFLTTTQEPWLYVHQVLTGWVGLALLWASLAFSRQARWRPAYLAVALFPVLWSYVAIYRLNDFLLAAGPAVLFLSLATLWTGWVFARYARHVGSHGAPLLAAVFVLWGLHHLDYPLLRARGAWNPWGYYLDIVFVLATGAGMVLLVLEDLRRGLSTLSVLSGDLQPRQHAAGLIESLLSRPLALPGVRGTALYLHGSFAGGVGACAHWAGTSPEGAAREAIAQAVSSGPPQITRAWEHAPSGERNANAYAAVLPVFRGTTVVGALVITGGDRDPFTALGDGFLLALGQQVGAALEYADLYVGLEARTHDLERLSTRMVQQHEEERRRISLELHDETAQVFSAVKMQLGLVREAVAPEVATRIDRVIALVDTGIGSIRSVTNGLRPPLLDDLGLLPALRALVAGFRERTGIAVTFDTPDVLPALGEGGELALFRALQEGLSNVARHAGARSVIVRLTVSGDAALRLEVIDDGDGPAAPDRGAPARMGLTGMRERLATLGGTLALRSAPGGGACLTVDLPVA
jgi:signal transduction histidine kinase